MSTEKDSLSRKTARVTLEKMLLVGSVARVRAIFGFSSGKSPSLFIPNVRSSFAPEPRASSTPLHSMHFSLSAPFPPFRFQKGCRFSASDEGGGERS